MKKMIATLAVVALTSTAATAGAQSRYDNGPSVARANNGGPTIVISANNDRDFRDNDRGYGDRDWRDRNFRDNDNWMRRNNGVRGNDVVFFPGRVEAERCNPRMMNCAIEANMRNAQRFCRINGLGHAVYFGATRRGMLADVVCSE